MMRLLGGAGLLLILFQLKGAVVPYVIAATFCGALLRARSRAPTPN